MKKIRTGTGGGKAAIMYEIGFAVKQLGRERRSKPPCRRTRFRKITAQTPKKHRTIHAIRILCSLCAALNLDLTQKNTLLNNIPRALI
jgi:hypothetical protein